ncbi:hypothetical protein FRC06_011626 [Ceratobasidium sp. 370]|nr:hypothetical protein FRC06_011626 [Ceratobasidium sp. 370]
MSSSTLPTRQISWDDVAALGFGAMGIGELAYRKVGDEESRYRGDSEVLIGNWFKRTDVPSNQVRRYTKQTLWDASIVCDVYSSFDLADYEALQYSIKQALDKSLKRLGVDTIDLYYVHRIDQAVPVETTIAALVEFINIIRKVLGRLDILGYLNLPWPPRRAHKVHPIADIRVGYSPFLLDTEQKGHLLDTARELGLPLGRGLLTGQITSYDDIPDGDFRKKVSKDSSTNFPKILQLVSKLKEIGNKHNATAGQVSLAFHIIPIPRLVSVNFGGKTKNSQINKARTKNIKYIEENLGVLKVGLTPEEIEGIRQAITETELTRDQYPPAHMEFLYGNTPELPK